MSFLKVLCFTGGASYCYDVTCHTLVLWNFHLLSSLITNYLANSCTVLSQEISNPLGKTNIIPTVRNFNEKAQEVWRVRWRLNVVQKSCNQRSALHHPDHLLWEGQQGRDWRVVWPLRRLLSLFHQPLKPGQLANPCPRREIEALTSARPPRPDRPWECPCLESRGEESCQIYFPKSEDKVKMFDFRW